MIHIVLMEPEHAGNIGAVARAMANFDLTHLVLVDPKVDHLCEEARCRAKHSQNVLDGAKVIPKKELWKSFDYVIGTTAKTGTDYNIPRSPLDAAELAKNYAKKWDSADFALLFGREGKGLSNVEVRKCDFVVKIDSSKKYGTLNLSHACSILFYEIFRHRMQDVPKVELARKEEKEVLLKKIGKLLDGMEFSTKDKKETQKKVWKRVIGKSTMTKREAFALIGFFKKL